MDIIMKRNYLWLMALLASPLLFTSCEKSQGAQQQQSGSTAVPVNAYQVTEKEVIGIDTYPGTLVPLNEVELRPQVAGYITDIYVEDGQKVTQGQQLYQIDRTKYQAAYQQAKANLQSAQANLARVSKDLDRYERLNEQEAIATQRVDYARTDVETAQSQVAAAEAQLSVAATDLKYSVITAPFSGTIGISQVRIGAQVSPGQPLLNTISSDDPITVDFVINEKEIPRFTRLRQGDQPDSLFTIRLGDGSIYPSPGKLVTIDRAVDRQTGTITVRLSLPNPDRQLIAGMTVNVLVMNQDIGKQVVIPYKAVTEQMGEYYVYIIQGDSVLQRPLDLGTKIENLVVVRKGLEEGESIVLEGIQRLRQGAKVQVDAPTASSQRAGSK